MKVESEAKQKTFFTERLLYWNSNENSRVMPWKGEKDPYKIWLSEIILQQTRVEQGLAYYNRFINEFPTVQQLAEAPEQQVFKLWEGLGYYSRCKNLIETAKYIVNNLNGNFPDEYEKIRALKGIGPYTAAAIASFAYNLPYAVVDGNVLRVLSRYFGIRTPIDSTEGRKNYNLLADELLEKKQPASYNQAIMDFGAVICKPQQPLCDICVQQPYCTAYKEHLIKVLPVKEKTLTKKTRWFYYFIVEYKDMFYIRKRSTRDIWENLYEFVLRESERDELHDAESFKAMFQTLTHQSNFVLKYVSAEFKQKLTHQTIVGRFIKISVSEPTFISNEYEVVLKTDLFKYPFPKIIGNFMAQNQEI